MEEKVVLVSPRGRRSVQALGVLCALALACAAERAVGPAVAQPKKPLTPARTVARPISEHNAERIALKWQALVGGFGRAVAVSGALGRVVASSEGPIHVFDLSSGKSLGTRTGCTEALRSGMAFGGGDRLVVACEDSVLVYKGRALAASDPLEIHASPVTAAVLAWPRLALGHHDGTLRIYSFDGAPTQEIAVPGPPIDVKSLALSRDGKKLAVAWIQGSIWLWDTSRPEAPEPIARHENESDSVAFDAGATLLAEEGRTNFTSVWSLDERPFVVKAELRNGAWVKRLLFTPDGKWLVRGGSDGLELAEVLGPRRVELDATGQVEDVALDEGGRHVAAIDRKGRLAVWAPR